MQKKIANIIFVLSALFLCGLVASAQMVPGFPLNPTFTTVTNGHEIAAGTALTFGSNGVAGAGAGTGPTITITGHDTDFQISVTTGTTPTGANAVICTITYATAFTGAGPYSQLTPASALADGLISLGEAPYVTNTTTTCVLTSGTTALAASTTYIWNIHSGQ